MKNLTYNQIGMLQKINNVDNMQESINSGICWKMEGSSGRFAMNCLESGACMLPLEPKYDYYGNRVPSRNMLIQGTKGTFQNSIQFWNKVIDGDFDTVDWLAETFGVVEAV